MKILLFANASWNIYNYRMNLARSLNAAGHQVHFFSPHDEYSTLIDTPEFQWHPIRLDRKGINPVREWASIRTIRRVYRDIQPDIVFHFTPKCVLYGSQAAKQLGIPHIINTITGLGYLFSDRMMHHPMYSSLLKFLYRRALRGTRVVFQNPEDMAAFQRWQIVQEPQAHLVRGSGVDLDRFLITAETSQPPIVVCPARLIREKGIDEFVAAARLLQERKVQARFVLVGRVDQGNPSAISSQVIQRWVREGVIEWWGWRNDMEKVYQDSSIVCLPTYYNEGTPKTLIEAAASGRPIVTCDIAGCRDIVEDGKNGYLVPIRNARAVADALQRLLENPEMRVQMGIHGRQLVKNGYRHQIINALMMEIAGIAPTPHDTKLTDATNEPPTRDR
ncbi:MAG: glycosyltransferase family 4 protein [Anaerolineae bacterium]|nr:glycosyltransferase family 4 protein [Anaerolineae bacterium]